MNLQGMNLHRLSGILSCLRMSRMRVRAALLALFCGPVLCGLPLANIAQAENRLALVIGNNAYPNLPPDKQLSKAVNDARAIGDALEKIGFSVTRGENLDRRGMVDRIFAFTQKIKPGDVAAVFYAGHGVAISGGNYLLPTDMPLPQPGEEPRVRNMAIGEADLIADIQERKARVAVMLIDACRDNPFRQPGILRSIGTDRGLQRGREAEGVFAVYSAGFGQSALDSLGPNDSSPNSVFTRALVPQLARAGSVHLGDLVIDMREDVAKLAASIGHQQYPAYYDQTRGGRVYLAARTTGGESAQQIPAPPPQSTPQLIPQAIPQPIPPPQIPQAVPQPTPQQNPVIAALPPQAPAPAPGPPIAYPTRPVVLVVPFPPGGTTDIIARMLADKMQSSLGQPVIIENVAGASGMIGASRVAKAAPDGYTLLVSDAYAMSTRRFLFANQSFDSRRDFQPVGIIASTPMVLVAPASSPIASMKDLVTIGQRKPGSLTYASSGVGTHAHMAMEALSAATGTQMVHVPYRGIAPALTDLIGGHISVALTPLGTAQPHLAAGKLRALAIGGVQRSAQLPNVPTFNEAGFNNFAAMQFVALFAPANVPGPIVAKLNAAMARAAENQRDSLRKFGMEAAPSTPDHLASLLSAADSYWATAFASAGIKPQ